MQQGFNLGFKEGATAGLAYGQVRGAACSVAIFAGQVPGSSRWKESIAETLRTMEQLAAPVDAVRAARVDFERAMTAEANGGEPATPLRRDDDEEGNADAGIAVGGSGGTGGTGKSNKDGAGGSGTSDTGGNGDGDGDDGDGAGSASASGSRLGRKRKSKGDVDEADDAAGGQERGFCGDGTFAGRMQAARLELETAGFELHDFKLT